MWLFWPSARRILCWRAPPEGGVTVGRTPIPGAARSAKPGNLPFNPIAVTHTHARARVPMLVRVVEYQGGSGVATPLAERWVEFVQIAT